MVGAWCALGAWCACVVDVGWICWVFGGCVVDVWWRVVLVLWGCGGGACGR